MYDLQENIRLTLCPNVTMNKINARCELILKQLKREVDSNCVGTRVTCVQLLRVWQYGCGLYHHQ